MTERDGMTATAPEGMLAHALAAEMLDHCRGPGPHVRGCQVVDRLLGKS